MDNSQRDLHGALLDAEILADVYLAMTGGQTNLTLSDAEADQAAGAAASGRIVRIGKDRPPLPVITASTEELAAHEAQLEAISRDSGGKVLWRDL